MKKILFGLFTTILCSTLIGCGIKQDKKTENECCDDCLCGDTLELIKNTQSAWTLVTIDSDGEYIIDRHSFINFHGTGKNRFAFFKNDENANPISKLTGDFSVTKNKEIILIPDDDNNKIICKIGEEKDLLAVLECDNLGIFILQKQGTIELPSIIKDTVINTKKIVITGNVNKTITAEIDINEILKIIYNSKRWTGAITSPSVMYDMDLIDLNENIIAKIEYTPGHYFIITINDKSYSLNNIDEELLNEIINK